MKVEEGNVSASEVAAKKAASERQYVELESQFSGSRVNSLVRNRKDERQKDQRATRADAMVAETREREE
jgi:hypothetical protein